jgi:hypothetical protein
VEIDGAVIRVTEVDVGPPCDCICPFDLEIAIEGLEPGTYAIDIRAFLHPDGSRHERLARLYPYGSSLWKEHYGARKNAVEGRNSQITRLGLKRIWSYGLSGAIADLSFADLLINLRTLGRLVQQATLLVS